MNLLELETQDPVAWCENNITLDYGAFDRENHPLMVEPMQAAAKMRGGTVGLIGSVQHIKTLTAQLLHLYKAATAPCRAAHYDLTKEALAEPRTHLGTEQRGKERLDFLRNDLGIATLGALVIDTGDTAVAQVVAAGLRRRTTQGDSVH